LKPGVQRRMTTIFPDLSLMRWASVLSGRIATDREAEDSVVEAARALVEVLVSEHVERLVDALLQAAPGLRERFSDMWLTELKEEIVQREDAKHVYATITLVEEIEQCWRQES
jgi:hypothetical protein